MPETVDVVVIGGGPAGYPAAAILARSGMRVALVEEHLLGGECTNYGCIPTKALYSRLLHSRLAGAPPPGLGGLAEWAWSGPVARSRVGVEEILSTAGVWVVRGRARLAGERLVVVEGGPELRAERAVLLAPGSEPGYPRGLEPDGEVVVDNRGFLEAIRRQPSRILIVGGGPVGVEYATIAALAGLEAILVEVMPRLLPGVDRSLGQAVESSLRRMGVRVYKRSTVERLERIPRGARVWISGHGSVEVDLVVVATGRRPSTRGLGLREAGVPVDEKGYIVVERPSMRTPAPWAYAAGDAAGPPLLAHKAFHESLAAAHSILGRPRRPPGPVPLVVYTHPEAASVGLTLEEARRRGVEAVEARASVGALARVGIEGGERGFVKIVYEAGTHRILGVHAFLPEAGELAGYAASLIGRGATLEDLASTVHPHPTVSEALWEAAMAALGEPVHLRGASRRGA
ncbi:MAG: NAD(P)/FAD-dependent oxidoreductase [Desulfurococcales archaeon]|nr:NAD(P)/FAD-dependent oxidoreductase [Desulfurococcales archaeon]